jgi:hypothetical protein
MNLLQSIVIYCFLLHLLNRPLNAFPKLYSLPHPCQGAFLHYFLSPDNWYQRPPSSTSLQKLKIWSWRQGAGSTPAAGTKKPRLYEQAGFSLLKSSRVWCIMKPGGPDFGCPPTKNNGRKKGDTGHESF